MRRFALSILSGVLLALTFYPFYLWPLALVALAPAVYFAVVAERHEVVRGALITIGIGFFPTLYFTLAQLVLQPQGVLLTYVVRASSILFLLGMGAAFGAVLLLYRACRTRSLLLNVLLAAALYTFFEALWYIVFGGYYYTSFSHALVSLPPARWYASVGGAALVSFVAVAINAVIAEAVYKHKVSRQRAWPSVCVFIVLLVASSVAAWWVRPPLPHGATMPVAFLQIAPYSLSDLPFGTMQGSRFSDPALEASLKSVSANGGLVIYPFSPVDGLVYHGAAPSTTQVAVPDLAIGQWLERTMPASTTVMVWNTLAEGGVLYDEDVFWQSGQESEYRKQDLYRFSDYSPGWAYLFGLQRSSSTITAGDGAKASVQGEHIAALICSEIQQSDLARPTSRGAPYLIAVGFDSMFPGDLAGEWSLAGARYRAAENNVVVVHGTILGPSAIINADGSLQDSLPFDTSGVIEGSVPKEPAQSNTIYNYTGSWPLYATAALIIAVAVLFKRRRYSSW